MKVIIDGKSFTVHKEVADLIHMISLERDDLLSAKIAGAVTDDFKSGVFWFEKEILDHFQNEGWVIPPFSIAEVLGDIIAKKIE